MVVTPLRQFLQIMKRRDNTMSPVGRHNALMSVQAELYSVYVYNKVILSFCDHSAYVHGMICKFHLRGEQERGEGQVRIREGKKDYLVLPMKSHGALIC